MYLVRGIRQIARGIGGYASLVVLLSLTATIPILQFASLGYMLECSSRMATNRPWRECFPGVALARRIVVALAMISLTWLPIWYLADLAYSAKLIDPDSDRGVRMRVASIVVSLLWVIWVLWSLYRGGRVRDFLWPAPLRFLRSIFQSEFWRDAEDRLWGFFRRLRIVRMILLGMGGALGAIAWLAIPATGMVIAVVGEPSPGKFAIGAIGALAMLWVLHRLPYLQVHFAVERRMRAFLDVKRVREAYRKTPWTMTISLLLLFAMAAPLYLLRIERIPKELEWVLTLFFVFFTFPSRLAIGWAWRRGDRERPTARWYWRWPLWPVRLAVIAVYIGILYLARFACWEGAAVFYLQHTFLPPIPFFVR